MEKKSDIDYLREAYGIAAARSEDKDTQVGAVIVLDGKIIAADANHFPRGVKVTPDRLERPKKYLYIQHAERNALDNLFYKPEGAIIYSPWFPCCECAKAIIPKGIVELVYHKDFKDFEMSLLDSVCWDDVHLASREMLQEAGVRLRCVSGKIGGVKIRFKGQYFEP